MLHTWCAAAALYLNGGLWAALPPVSTNPQGPTGDMNPARSPISHAGAYNQIQLESPVLLENELQAIQSDTALHTQVGGFAFFRFQQRPVGIGPLEHVVVRLCRDLTYSVNPGAVCDPLCLPSLTLISFLVPSPWS